MFALTDTTEKLQLKTTTTSEVHIVVCYNDFAATGTTKGIQLTKVTTATTTDICDAPAVDVARVIERITIKIYGASTNIVTVKYDISATDYEITPDVPLATGEIYEYENGAGWVRKNASGVLLTAAVSGGVAAGGTTGQVYTKNSATDYDAGWATPSGGAGGGVTWATIVDSDFTAADDEGYDIQVGDITGTHVIDVSGITTSIEFMNGQDDYDLTFTGESVCMRGGLETIDKVPTLGHTTLKRINGKLILY